MIPVNTSNDRGEKQKMSALWIVEVNQMGKHTIHTTKSPAGKQRSLQASQVLLTSRLLQRVLGVQHQVVAQSLTKSSVKVPAP